MELILSFLIVLAAAIFGTPFLLCFWRYYLCPKKKTDKVKARSGSSKLANSSGVYPSPPPSGP